MSFKDKVVLITGASAGIGKSTAVAFAKEGAKLAITGRNAERLESVAEICKQIGVATLAIGADVTKDEDAKSAVQKTIDRFGQLDILINNAGVFRKSNILDGDYMETYDLINDTNMRSVALITHLAAPHIIKTKGNIVNISSVAATKVSPNFSAYRCLKAALNHFTKCVATDLAPYGVRVNSVSPGPVHTDIFEAAGLPELLQDYKNRTTLGKISQPEEVADLIVFVASDKAKSVIGSDYEMDNGVRFT